ncbi:MAG TPA: phospholipid scramblase-related protein [Candidatus Nitrosotenuis sp.]|nr:phospholipid scramblase-related protein [Candidatus Nitrosotenuis sp.]
MGTRSPSSRPSPGGTERAPGQPFYLQNLFVVQPFKASLKKRNYYNILNEGGVVLGHMFHRPDPLHITLLRLTGSHAVWPADITLTDRQGQPLVRLVKGFSFGQTLSARILDGGGNRLGSVCESRLGFEGRRYEIQDLRGRVVGALEGDWRAGNMQIKDGDGANIGKIGRKAEGINKVIFVESNYFVVHLYVDQAAEVRRLLLGVAAAIELLLR